jgi:putative selenium metabolism hydrolase
MADREAKKVDTVGSDVVNALWDGAETLREPMVDFTRRLIQTPSLPGEEGDVALIVADEMRRLDYDEVRIDEAGNVIGCIRATAPPADGRPKRSIMFNTHMDHVDVGDPSRWPHPPYEGVVQDGEIWGRGASDLKGALACHTYAGALLKRAGLPLPNDIYVVGVVQEEVSGLGSFVLADNLQTDYVILGEPSQNELALGHRGRVEVHVTITGKSVHASVPHAGINPLYSMSKFLLAVQSLEFEQDPQHPGLGPTSIAPTLLFTDQTSPNVVPGECRVVLDVRNTPMDTPEVVRQRVQELLDASLEGGASGKVDIPPLTLTSYTGVSATLYGHEAFGIAPDSELATRAVSAVSAALKRDVPTKMWRFATDAGHFTAKGVQVIGFGPGYEDVIHTVDERISIRMMVEGMVANAALALAL